MKIVESTKFKQQLRKIVFNIKKDKVSASIKFAKDLKEGINTLSNMPRKYRASIYHNNENMRDMIFKGYTIVYEVKENEIVIKQIFNKNLPSENNY